MALVKFMGKLSLTVFRGPVLIVKPRANAGNAVFDRFVLFGQLKVHFAFTPISRPY